MDTWIIIWLRGRLGHIFGGCYVPGQIINPMDQHNFPKGAQRNCFWSKSHRGGLKLRSSQIQIRRAYMQLII